MRRSAFIGVVVVVALVVLSGLGIDARDRLGTWAIAPLGTLPGFEFSEALAINDRNEIAGVSGSSNGIAHAALWHGGEIIDLGTLGGLTSRAWGINDRGQVVGEAQTADGDFHAFLWEDGVMTDLSAAGPFNRAFEINRRGEIVGHHQLQSLLWRDGALIPLDLSAALDINDHSVVAGSVFDIGVGSRAAIWRDGSVVELALPPGATDSGARAINQRSVVVGESLVGGIVQAFRWEDGTTVRLPSLIPSGATFALDVDHHGVVVGQSMSDPNTVGGAPHGVAWLGDQIVDLGTLSGGTLSVAWAINDRGIIAGFSTDATGLGQAVVWVPQ